MQVAAVHIALPDLDARARNGFAARFEHSAGKRNNLATGLLALLALIGLRSSWAGALALVWVFNIVGTVDLLNALRHVDVAPSFGAAWYIPTFLVPLLLVTHFMIFRRLLKSGDL